MQIPNQSGLTAERMQMFLAGLAGLPEDEVRKAKLLYIRNELSQLKATKASLAAFGVAQGCFALIPVFWPIIWVQRAQMKTALVYQAEQIRNALGVWGPDLGNDAAELERQLRELES